MFNPITWFAGVPHEWAVFFLSMIPITELRASIPIGIEVYNMLIWKVLFIAIIGDFIPAFLLLYFFPKLHDWLIKRKFFGGLVSKKLKQAEKAFSGKYSKYGAFGLVFFVAIPLPFTGSWTGSLASFIFNIPLKKSWWLILLGITISAFLVTLITLFAGSTLGLLL